MKLTKRMQLPSMFLLSSCWLDMFFSGGVYVSAASRSSLLAAPGLRMTCCTSTRLIISEILRSIGSFDASNYASRRLKVIISISSRRSLASPIEWSFSTVSANITNNLIA